MRKKQLIQLLQFILARTLLGLFVIFVMEESFIDFILKYRFYLLILSLSYFYYYSIEYEPDKKYKLIRNIIIYGNVYLFLHIFFRPLLNISHQLFILLGLIILGLWWTTTLNSRRKYLLQIIGGIFSFFILISGILYFYPDAPNVQGFLKNRNNEIMILGINDTVNKKDAYIRITNTKGNEDFDIHPNFSKILSENAKISYPSLKERREEKVIIITPQGDLIQIFPQSEIQIEFEGKNLKKIEKLNGKIGFLSGIFESNIEIIGNERLSIDEEIGLIGIQETYKHDFISHLKNQISDSKINLANNTIMYNIDGIIVKLLAKMFPITFGKNLKNYKEFQNYLGELNNEIYLSRYTIKQGTGTSINSIWGNIKNNMNIGKNNTYGWFKKPEYK